MSAPAATTAFAATAASTRTGEMVRGASAHPVKIRLTKRGRAVFGALAALLVGGLLAIAAVIGSSALGATQAQASAEQGGAEFGYIVAQPGDSLWGIAAGLDQKADPRDTIAEILRLNQLSGSDVEAGQAIAVPLRYKDAPGVVPASEL